MRKVRKVLYVLICVIMVGCMINVSNIQASTSSKISPPKVVLVKATGTSEIRIKWKKVVIESIEKMIIVVGKQ